MSIENPFSINGSWKIDPDGRQDRSSGPCISRTMTKAEKIKYGMTVESEDDMKITKVAVKQMAASGMSNNDIADPVDDERIQSATSIKEISEQAKKQVDNTARESADKIKLSQAVDEMMEMVPDSINHPAHYTAGKIEVIDYLQEKMTPDMFEGFCVGNALKYLSRYRFKGGVEDLKKAEWYLNRIISAMETA